ncbi:peptidoglycan-binding protein, partial [Methylobacterium trifolii]
MASRSARNARSLNVWPGYVDALATLLLSVVFLLTVFVVGQFFLSQELSGRDTLLARLNRQIADLTDLLSLERSTRRSEAEAAQGLRTTLLAVEAERDRIRAEAQ